MGNPNLFPEYTQTDEFTVIQNWSNTSLNITLFHHNANDVFSAIIEAIDNITISSLQNIRSGKNTGLEANNKIDALDDLSAHCKIFFI